MSLGPIPNHSELPDYEYVPLTSRDSLRLLRLIPASNGNQDVDCELVEFYIPDSNTSRDKAAAAAATLSEEDPELLYEAVSWCWGRETYDQVLRIHHKDKVYAFHTSQNLKSALVALRKNDLVRQLWIDAICINQRDLKERNEQVPRMDKIYGGATNVCIWLGEESDDSKLAIDFIKQIVLSLWDFDKLIEDRRLARQWAALVTLMKRRWFSRRWVVQEIALSPKGGIIYCGQENVSWQDFADAISLFVEVESATHRLSDVMKRDQLFNHIPDFFGDVSTLGAALLVEATSNLFRSSLTDDRKPRREPLATLESLVSRLSVFEAAQPRDTIYALLAISKDTTPQSVDHDPSRAEETVHALARTRAFLSQPYKVDYHLPVIDVYKEFIEFSIRKSDKTRALDIICRPWAPIVMKSHDELSFIADPSGTAAIQRCKDCQKLEKDQRCPKHTEPEDEESPLPSWIPSLSGAAFEMEEHPIVGLQSQRQNADSLVGMPGSDQRNYSAAGTKSLNVDKLRLVKFSAPCFAHWNPEYLPYSMVVQGFILDEVKTVEQIASNGNIPFQWLSPGGWSDTNKKPPEAFWRTLVADRGTGGRNPPTYFPRACLESMFFKNKTKSRARGTLDCKKLINEGRCTIVAEFLRRVQAVIWNRLLMTTKSGPPGGRLGLVRDDVRPGDKVCILYGCSVPVILRKFEREDTDMMLAEQNANFEEWRRRRRRAVIFLFERYQMIVKLREAKARKAKGVKIPVFPKTGPLPWLPNHRLRNTWPPDIYQQPNTDESPIIIRDANNKWILREDWRSGQHGNLNEPPPPPEPERETEPSHNRGGKPKGPEYFAKLKEDGQREASERETKEFALAMPQKSYYRLMGECYVHDMMNGEAISLQNSVKEKKPAQYEVQNFDLR